MTKTRDRERSKTLGRRVGEIMASDEYLDAVEATYGDDQLLAELQANPRAYLQKRGHLALGARKTRHTHALGRRDRDDDQGASRPL